MKFSYSLLKKFVPKIPDKKKFADVLARKAFEVEEIKGDTIDIKITANRWADASCHRGIAREAAAIFSAKENVPVIKKLPGKSGKVKVAIKTPKCLRYIGVAMDIDRIGSSPSWMKKVLESCGLRPINGVVDILNYVMLEVGQPMHAFDADKLEDGIVVRPAYDGEKITTIDGRNIKLSSKSTVIADKEKALAIAGIKGGKDSEITGKTRKIIIESASFDAVSIYKTARDIDLKTDASQRYGHGVSSETAMVGASRAVALISEICGGKVKGWTDIYPKHQPVRKIKFDAKKFEKITGVSVPLNKALSILRSLGFKGDKSGVVEVPWERLDVNIFEDLAEEVIRIYGLDEIESKAPFIEFVSTHSDKIFDYKEKIKNEAVSLGYNEVYSYSFGDDESSKIELLNPISQNKRFMRSSLLPLLEKMTESISRNSEEVKIFEVGKVFESLGREHWSLALSLFSKKDKFAFRDLKWGVVEILTGIGLTDISFSSEKNNPDKADIRVGNHLVGYLDVENAGQSAFAEMNLEKTMSLDHGKKYRPDSSYPSITRDISLWVSGNTSSDDIISAVKNTEPANLSDIDLIDCYSNEKKTALLFRLVFRSYKKTLLDSEIDGEMAKITASVKSLPDIEIR